MTRTSGISDGFDVAANSLPLLPTKDGICYPLLWADWRNMAKIALQGLVSLGLKKPCGFCPCPLGPCAKNAVLYRRGGGDGMEGNVEREPHGPGRAREPDVGHLPQPHCGPQEGAQRGQQKEAPSHPPES